MMDVFNNLNAYYEARDILHQGGHKILIDGASPEMVHILNIKRLEPDLVKIFWNPMMEYDTDSAEIRNFINELGADKVILAKCIDDKAMRWGVSYGIRSFQGPYIDNLEIALLRSKCPDSARCTATECLKRKRLVAGDMRRECTQSALLDNVLEE